MPRNVRNTQIKRANASLCFFHKPKKLSHIELSNTKCHSITAHCTGTLQPNTLWPHILYHWSLWHPFNIQTKYQLMWPDQYRTTIWNAVSVPTRTGLGGATSHPTKALSCTLLHSRSGAHPRLHLSKSHGHHRQEKKYKIEQQMWQIYRHRARRSRTWASPWCLPAVKITYGDRRRSRLGGIWCPANCAWLPAKCTVSCTHTNRLRRGQRLAVLLEQQRLCPVSQPESRAHGDVRTVGGATCYALVRKFKLRTSVRLSG